MKEKVRVHLKQAILVGYGDEAKYAKVLVGERDRTLHGQNQERTRSRSTAFIIFGFVRGYRGVTLAGGPIRLWVEDDNILAIEEARVEQEYKPQQHHMMVLRCTLRRAMNRDHAPHRYRNDRVMELTQCPGWGQYQ